MRHQQLAAPRHYYFMMMFNMQRIAQRRALPLILASLCIAGSVSAITSEAGVPVAAATNSTSADVAAPSAPADVTPPKMARIEVIAAQFKTARIELSPKVGTTIYTIDTHMIDHLGQGSDTPFNEVLLRLPGVAQDSKAAGSIHVRDDHANVQYRIDGVQLPESIAGFGQSIDTRLVDQIDFIPGALPAQFGLRTSGIVDIQTKEGAATPGWRIGVLAGSHNYVEPSAEVFGSRGAFNYYLSGSYLSNGLGIENLLPASCALHDQTQQRKSFGALSYFIDDSTRLGLLFGTYNGRFQIPNNPCQVPGFSRTGMSDSGAGTSTLTSDQLNEQQREVNRFVVLSLQKSLGDLNYQVSAFHQYSQLRYTPDTACDLIYNGVASDSLRSNTANGAQFDLSYKLIGEHTLQAGLAYPRQVTHSNNTVALVPTDASGAQSATYPLAIIDNSGKTGTLASIYLHDEWHITKPLTLNYGVRFDKVSAFINEQQVSPRLNLAYKLDDDTALHAGYSRYFTPPLQELAAQASIDQYAGTSSAPAVPVSDNVKAERTYYFDVGQSHHFDRDLTFTADASYKRIANLLDEGQYGQALILSPFNISYFAL